MDASITPRYVASYLDSNMTSINIDDNYKVTIHIMFHNYMEAKGIRDVLGYPWRCKDRRMWSITDEDDVRKMLTFMAENCVGRAEMTKKLMSRLGKQK
jgi:hypothetical protein